MLMITELLTPTPGPLWRLVKQAGIDHAVTGWARTHHDVPLRGGARSGGYDDATMRRASPVAEPGNISTGQLWAAHEYFLRAVVPVAEEAGVRICLHPDDPPLPEVRGVPRIMGTPAAFDRVLATVPSASSGITVCQGNFTLMTDDLPALIRRWGAQGKIFFVRPACPGRSARTAASTNR
jgi:mannonate dehydratase